MLESLEYHLQFLHKIKFHYFYYLLLLYWVLEIMSFSKAFIIWAKFLRRRVYAVVPLLIIFLPVFFPCLNPWLRFYPWLNYCVLRISTAVRICSYPWLNYSVLSRTVVLSISRLLTWYTSCVERSTGVYVLVPRVRTCTYTYCAYVLYLSVLSVRIRTVCTNFVRVRARSLTCYTAVRIYSKYTAVRICSYPWLNYTAVRICSWELG